MGTGVREVRREEDRREERKGAVRAGGRGEVVKAKGRDEETVRKE